MAIPPPPETTEIPEAPVTPIPAIEQGKENIPMSSDTVVLPAGQASVVGHGGREGCHNGDKSFEAVHWATASDHRATIAGATDARFQARDHADTLRSFTDLERQNGERFQVLANAIKSESAATREMIQAHKLDDLRFQNLRLELAK